MSRPLTGYQWTVIQGGVGTTVVTANPANLIGVFIPGTYVGTVFIHDASAATGTTGSSSIVGTLGIGLPTTSIPQFLTMPARCRNGILFQATGTPLMTLFWDGL